MIDLASDPEVVHQYREFPGECDDGLAFSFAFGNRESPPLELRISLGEKTCVRRLDEESPHLRVAFFCDPPEV